jgi:hypothetical protein
VDHCQAGAYLAQDWDFPEELATAIATHHDEPLAGRHSLDCMLQVSWRLADTLGYAAFSPNRAWSWQELMPFLPNAGSAWFGSSPERAKSEIDDRLASAPL